jgi:hypothetical protein
MIRSLSMAFLSMSLVVSLSGCRRSLTQYVAKASEELGIEIALKTTDDDTCALYQMQYLLQEYSDMTGASQGALKVEMQRKYRSLVLDPTVQTRKVTGIRNHLTYVTPDTQPNQERDIDELVYEGTEPVAQKTEQDGVLTLTLQSQYNDYQVRGYVTREQLVFNIVTDLESLARAVRSGFEPVYTSQQRGIGCAKLISFKDLL